METKENIIALYLQGGVSYQKLSITYGYSRCMINRWVQAFRREREALTLPGESVNLEIMPPPTYEQLQERNQQLSKDLDKQRLHTQLLEQLIAAAERELQIPITKKSGAKQCKK